VVLRWFGIVLLPIVSFSADAAVAVTFFIRQWLKAYFRFSTPSPPESLAQARAIDMSIQFLLFWMPFLTLLGWWTNKPLTLLFGRCHYNPAGYPC
jgi:Ca2+:H+ antiporter